MKTFFRLHKIPIVLVLGSLLFYGVFAFDLQREDFPKLLALFFALFFLYIKLIQFEKWNFKFLLVSGILFRLVFLIALPNLSQDFYRFIWDGELINQGINPYLYTPNELMENSKFQIPNSNELHMGMGSLSARHYSNYPSINQLIFTISAFLGMGSILGSVIWMRIFIILADVGILYFGRKVLSKLNLSPHFIFWYFLNPLVIIELTGNLHFEGVMLFFFIWAFYLIVTEKALWAAPVYAASIMLKLVPLLFLPLFLKYFGLRKSVAFYPLVMGCCVLYFIPFYTPSLIENYSQTIGLWFANFEFNAGLYNLVKFIGVEFFDAKPWLLIKSYGTLVKIVTIVFILLLAFIPKKNTPKTLLKRALFILLFYYGISATVHPWYLVFPLLLCVFTDYRSPVLWSAVVILSYFAYVQTNFEENLLLIGIEYVVVTAFFVYEFVKNHNNSGLIRKKT